jgi:pimeloyl-ACP methyl ester carboxylesterase
MSKQYIFCITFLVLIVTISTSTAQNSETITDNVEPANNSHILNSEQIDELLVKPSCIKPIRADEKWKSIEEFPVESKGITLSSELYLPEGEGPWPAVILVPGGFNETELIMLAPRFDAPRLAQCGFAAVVYYKRGTGLSGGSYAEATYDDFIDDVGNIAKQLAEHPLIDANRIGACGGSGGGFVSSIAAARYPEISFAINKSGPMVEDAEAGNYNISHALRSRGYADSLVDAVMPLWRKHHAAWDNADTAELQKVAEEISEKREIYDMFLLPTPYDEVFTDSNLIFLWPKFRSASRDYLPELESMCKKWLSIYGENDPIVPVTPCVQNIVKMMKTSGNDEYTIIILPDVGHSFANPATRQQIPVIRIVLNWLNKNIK